MLDIVTDIEEKGAAAPLGFGAAAVHAGLKRRRPDLALLVSRFPARVAGVFTRNTLRSAVVDVAEGQVSRGIPIRSLLVISGNANACVGVRGGPDTHAVREALAAHMGHGVDEAMVAATGVIGKPLPMETVAAGIRTLPTVPGPETARSFAQAILTTDKHTKVHTETLRAGWSTVTVGGTAKGSGMIHPDMATTLAFVTTDAEVAQGDLQHLLHRAVAGSFNALTVDGDTSTNDTALLLANGASGVRLNAAHPDWGAFEAAVVRTFESLAAQVAADGEGATLQLRVEVTGALSVEEARRAARTVASSLLVKTAMYGRDPNWGRIAAALGRSGVEVAEGDLTIAIQGAPYFVHGAVVDGPERIEGDGTIVIGCDLGRGTAAAHAVGCDLTEGYVRINSRYHT